MIKQHILRKAIDTVFKRYDKDGSSTLNKFQLQNCLNDVINHLGCKIQVNDYIVGQLMNKVDDNHNGQITKDQFFDLFRWVEANHDSIGNQGNNNQNNNYQYQNNYGNNSGGQSSGCCQNCSIY